MEEVIIASRVCDDDDHGDDAIDGDAPRESSFDSASRWDVSVFFETKKGTDDANVVSR